MKIPDMAEAWLRDIPQQFQGKHNIEILLKTFARQLKEVQSVFEDMNTKLDLDKAVGKNLDYIGTIIPLSRKEAGELCGFCLPEPAPVLSDERYVQILKYKLLKNTSDCTYYDIIAGLEYLYEFPFLYREDPQRPATIILEMPLDLDKPDFQFYRRLCLKPGGVRILGEKKFLLLFLASIRYENRLTIIGGFYPRCNIPEIFLDASSYLDGTYPLNGYQHTQDISPRLLDATDLLNGRRLLDSFWEIQIPEFYPARLTVRGLFHNNLQFLQQLHIVLETLLSIRLEPSIQIASRFYPRNNIPLLYVNAEAALDGEFLLNGRMDIWNLSFLYLTGMASLDGVCSLNGYEDNPSYEFYPASMEIFANYQTPIRLSEQVHSVMGAQLPLPLTAASNLSMTSRFYPRYQPPAIYLNGGTKLDGTYSLHGREESEDIPSCFLNGEASLDGAYSLHGYQNNQDLGFYPATLQVQGEITQKIEVSSQSKVIWNTPLLIESESNCSIIGKANKEIAYETDLKLSGQIKQPVLWNPETMTVEYHVWYLDGKKGLNGQVCLDADIYEIEL